MIKVYSPVRRFWKVWVVRLHSLKFLSSRSWILNPEAPLEFNKRLGARYGLGLRVLGFRVKGLRA